ncbi:MAG: hypothetical protein ACI4R5_04510 [Acetatifactor sp.]
MRSKKSLYARINTLERKVQELNAQLMKKDLELMLQEQKANNLCKDSACCVDYGKMLEKIMGQKS